jgi:hypothetical protein
VNHDKHLPRGKELGKRRLIQVRSTVLKPDIEEPLFNNTHLSLGRRNPGRQVVRDVLYPGVVQPTVTLEPISVAVDQLNHHGRLKDGHRETRKLKVKFSTCL